LDSPGANELVFTSADGSPRSLDNPSRDLCRTVLAFDPPRITFLALWHSHAFALIAARLEGFNDQPTKAVGSIKWAEAEF